MTVNGAANSVNYSALIRDMWPQSDIYDEILDPTNTYYGMVQKDTTLAEQTRHIAVGYGTTGGLGANFANAKASKAPPVQSQFGIQPATQYSIFSIDRLLARRSQNKKAVILPAIERSTKMAFAGLKLRQGVHLWGNGIGTLSQVTAISGATMTIGSGSTANADDMRKFQANWAISLSSDNTGVAGLRNQTQPLVITKLSRQTAVLTFSVNVTTAIPGAVVGDYVYYYGDYGTNAVTGYPLLVQGPSAWIPTTAPSATAFFGLDRTTDIENLSGWRVSCLGYQPKAAAIKGATVLAANTTGKPTYLFQSPTDWQNLAMELESAGPLHRIQAPAAAVNKYTFGINYEGIEFMGPTGPIRAFFDQRTPTGSAWMLQLDNWTLATVGEAPYIDQEDGNVLLREPDADSLEGRIAFDGQNYCDAPGFQAVLNYNL